MIYQKSLPLQEACWAVLPTKQRNLSGTVVKANLYFLASFQQRVFLLAGMEDVKLG